MKTLFDEIEAANKKITPETVEHYTRANVDHAWRLLEELKQRFEDKSVYNPENNGGFSDEQIAHLEKIESIKENTKEKKYDAFRNECVLFFEKHTGKDLLSFSDSKKILACIYLIQRKNGRQRFPLADMTEYLDSIRSSNNTNNKSVIDGNRREMHETLKTLKEEDQTFLIRTLLEMTKSQRKEPGGK
jgi:hypothetical protein